MASWNSKIAAAASSHPLSFWYCLIWSTRRLMTARSSGRSFSAIPISVSKYSGSFRNLPNLSSTSLRLICPLHTLSHKVCHLSKDLVHKSSCTVSNVITPANRGSPRQMEAAFFSHLFQMVRKRKLDRSRWRYWVILLFLGVSSKYFTRGSSLIPRLWQSSSTRQDVTSFFSFSLISFKLTSTKKWKRHDCFRKML